MNDDIKRYTQIKEALKTSQTRLAQAQGARDVILKDLKKQFGCSTLKEAQEKLELLKKQQTTANKQFQEALDNFEEKWGDKLEIQ